MLIIISRLGRVYGRASVNLYPFGTYYLICFEHYPYRNLTFILVYGRASVNLSFYIYMLSHKRLI